MLSLLCEKCNSNNNHLSNAYQAYVACVGLYGKL